MALSKGLLSRLVCAKYLFLKGQDELGSASQYAAGVATNHFQDSAELFLRVIAEYLGALIRPETNFYQLIDAIDKQAVIDGKEKIWSRTQLTQLNRARVNFKHFGTPTGIDEVRKYVHDLELFFQIASQKYLDLEFSSVSFADLISHTRTANWLRNAERCSDDGMYPEACAHASVAVYLGTHYYRGHSYRPHTIHRSLQDTLKHKQQALGSMEGLSPAVFSLAQITNERFDKVWNYIELLFEGVSLPDYRRFRLLSTDVRITGVNKVNLPAFDESGHLQAWQLDHLPQIGPQEAAFCLRFALDTILSIQSSLPIDTTRSPSLNIEYRVIRKSDVIVHPSHKELLRTANVDETLLTNSHCLQHCTDDYVAIVEDGELAYVPRKHVVAVEQSGSVE